MAPSNSSARQTKADSGGAEASTLVSKMVMHFVPEIAPANLISELELGLTLYQANVLGAINADLEARIIEILNRWLPHLVKNPNQRALTRVVNSVISPGQSGIDRTRSALIALKGWDSQYLVTQSKTLWGSLFQQLFEGKLEVFESKGQVCNTCKKKIKKDQYGFKHIKLNQNSDIWYLHAECLATSLIREQAKKYRSAKGALDKQAIAVRGILNANKNDINLKGKKLDFQLLGTSINYEGWLQSLLNTWTRNNTSVKEDFRPSYESAFREFAGAFAEYAKTNQFPVQAIKERLAKHLEASIVESVLERALQTDREAKNRESQSAGPFMYKVSTHPDLSDKSDKIQRIITIDAKQYNDARAVGEAFRTGNSVILNCTSMVEDDRKRIIDFASGLVFAENGTIQRLAPSVFLLESEKNKAGSKE